MEGLIPFIYRAVAQYRKEGHVSFGDLFFDDTSSPTTSYFRLPGDSGRYQLFSQMSSTDSGAVGAPRRSPAHRRRPPGEHGSIVMN